MIVGIIMISIVLFMVVCLYSIWHASTHFHKVYYRLSSDKVSKPVKFVFLSDLHDKEFGKDNETLLNAITEECPDMIMIAGDMLTASEERNSKVCEQLIQKLTENYPVYYGMGNHEAKMGWHPEKYQEQYRDYVSFLHKTGVHLLRNESVYLPEYHMQIFGLDMEYKYYRRCKRTPMEDDYLQEKLGKQENDSYKIVLAHNPTYFDKYSLWNGDLILSGHVHGGLVRLPFLGGVIAPSLRLFPKYDGGKFEEHGTTMILSRGIGIHSVEFRMWNPGEVVVVEIIPA